MGTTILNPQDGYAHLLFERRHNPKSIGLPETMVMSPGLLSEAQVEQLGALSEEELLALPGLLQRLQHHGIKGNKGTIVDALRIALTSSRILQVATENLLAHADKTRATRPLSLTVADVVSEHTGMPTRNCNSKVLLAHQYARHPQVQAAYAKEQMNESDRRRIVQFLNELAITRPDATPGVENRLVEAASRNGGAGLRGAIAKEKQKYLNISAAKQAQMAREKAIRERYVSFKISPHTIRFHGSLPRKEGETVLEALGIKARHIRAQEIQNRTTITRLPARYCDALIEICSHHTSKIHVRDLLNLEHVPTWASPATMRQAVIHAYHGQYDLGRSARTASPQLREIVLARDSGCIFTPCDEHASNCEIHHVKPWKDGGNTDLDNLVSLCPRHHAALTYEQENPNKYAIEFDYQGIPLVIPPRVMDPHRNPKQNPRYFNYSEIAYHANARPRKQTPHEPP